ncbi:hypothetical protein GSI_12884 [Ganoderma sinense ZZ0214-1]|uniref:choline-phosphate cytidylyltransferase n=1 Tax=Ganoderma sinense ZZ0214-1 TaxID=1077348 RepID=A0A2G8RU04_9APHY|nr:hypothetical protein GSI_12884 [Ganoderma sinense ZZ0214-1]
MAMRRSLDALSVLSTDDLADYDVISDGPRSLESSIADLGAPPRFAGGEPAPLPSAREKFDTVALTAEEIQAYVQRSLNASLAGGRRDDSRTWRVYVDGVFGPLSPRDVLQLRQAKLSFPSVHLLVGVFSDELCDEHSAPTALAHEDRCEVLRHCRWVDEVVPDVPWTLHERFLRARQIDFVAIDEGTSIDPDCDRDRLKGYDLVKGLRKSIPTRRTNMSTPMPRHHNPFRQTPPSQVAEGTREQEGNEKERERDGLPPSARGTIKGPPIGLKEESELRAGLNEALENPFEEPKDTDTTPFEEPRVDEFGTGHGV